jgi:hypothetical protein
MNMRKPTMVTTNPHSRAERIAAEVIKKNTMIGTIDSNLIDGICRSIDLLPCSLETLSDTQIVDIVGRLISVHFVASRYAQCKHDVQDPNIVKLTKFVIGHVDNE